MKRLLTIVTFIFFSSLCLSQEEGVKVVRIKAESVPDAAVQMLDSLIEGKKIRWFKTENDTLLSYDARAKHKGNKLNFQFSENGVYEKTVFGIKRKDIPTGTFKNLSNHLSNQYDKYKIGYTQIQYLDNINSLLIDFQSGQTEQSPEIKYQIAVSVKEGGAWKMFEYIFDGNGQYIERSDLKFAMTDNLEY